MNGMLTLISTLASTLTIVVTIILAQIVFYALIDFYVLGALVRFLFGREALESRDKRIGNSLLTGVLLVATTVGLKILEKDLTTFYAFAVWMAVATTGRFVFDFLWYKNKR